METVIYKGVPIQIDLLKATAACSKQESDYNDALQPLEGKQVNNYEQYIGEAENKLKDCYQ